MTQPPKYAQQYFVKDNCLFETGNSKQGDYTKKLCNFVPRANREIIKDDGISFERYVQLGGVHQSGRQLPEITIPAGDVEGLGWIVKYWGMDCILEPGLKTKASVWKAIQSTALDMERITVFSTTGWRHVDGNWRYLLPGDEQYTVELPGKMHGYGMERSYKELKNPFAGILFCEKCGTALKRNVPGKNQGTAPWFRCPNRNCDCRIVKCHTVEEAIRDAMEDWLDEYIIQLNSESRPKVDPIATALEAVQAQLAGLQQQQDNLCDYLEKGVYTIEIFTKRNATLIREIKQLQASEADLMRKQESGSQASKAAMEIIPTTQHILDNYDVLTIAEKNRLWKLVLKKATVYRTPDGELSVHIYPKLPK